MSHYVVKARVDRTYTDVMEVTVYAATPEEAKERAESWFPTALKDRGESLTRNVAFCDLKVTEFIKVEDVLEVTEHDAARFHFPSAHIPEPDDEVEEDEDPDLYDESDDYESDDWNEDDEE